MPLRSTVKPPLTLPLITPLTTSSCFEGLLQLFPGFGTLGLLAGQTGLTETVFDGVECHLDYVADADGQFAVFVTGTEPRG